MQVKLVKIMTTISKELTTLRIKKVRETKIHQKSVPQSPHLALPQIVLHLLKKKVLKNAPNPHLLAHPHVPHVAHPQSPHVQIHPHVLTPKAAQVLNAQTKKVPPDRLTPKSLKTSKRKESKNRSRLLTKMQHPRVPLKIPMHNKVIKPYL